MSPRVTAERTGSRKYSRLLFPGSLSASQGQAFDAVSDPALQSCQFWSSYRFWELKEGI